MKKLIFVIAILVGFVKPTIAQNDTVIYMTNHPSYTYICSNCFDRIIVYSLSTCTNLYWEIDGVRTDNVDPMIIDIIPGHTFSIYNCVYGNEGCYDYWDFSANCTDDYLDLPNPMTQTVWRRQSESAILQAVGNDSIGEPYWYEYLWSTGQTDPIIQVTDVETDTVTCEIRTQYGCASVIRTFIVRDNVELYRATTNLRSNLNEVTWKTSEEQAEYVNSVKVFRNNQLIATVPYADGIFTDNIGSEATQWQYHLQAVDNEGNDCPIPSYWKRTIHLDHVQGTQGNEILQWTPYQQEGGSETVTGYGIYDVVNGEPRLIITVGDFTNVYAYNPADFDGFGSVAAVFSRDGEEGLAFSNLTGEVLEVNKHSAESIAIYPNPATNGQVTLNGTGKVSITNAIGQTVKEVELNGKTSIELPCGIYFIQNNGATTKLVVE